MTPVLTKASKKTPSAWSDERLVGECLSGNEEAWSLLIERYKALIYSIPVKYRLPPHEAADVFQATCMELLKRLPQLREPRALPKWLMQVAHHQCYRWKQQQQRLVSRDADPDLPVPQTPAIAETLVQQTQEEQMLRDAVAPSRRNAAVWLNFFSLKLPRAPTSKSPRNWVWPLVLSASPARNVWIASASISATWDLTDAHGHQKNPPGRSPAAIGSSC